MVSQLLARVRGMWNSFGCSPSETFALALLAAGAIAATGVLWLASAGGALPAPFDGVESGEGVANELSEPGSTHADDPPAPGAAAEPDGGLDLTDAPLTVHVAGAVASPGLVELPGGSRVADALAEVGGPTDSAALDVVNLARPVNDGEQLYIPEADADGGHADAATVSPQQADQRPDAGSSAVRPDGTLDLNRADVSDFEELPGVGPVLAERIVDHRETIGGFTSVGELRDVAGIGEVRFQELSELVGL